MMHHLKIKNKLTNIVGNKYILVFSGFSGLGYENPVQLEEKLNTILDDAIRDHGRENVLVVAGATEEGIGAVYHLAKEKGIAILGIVSEEANAMPLATNEQETVFIPDPDKTWKVLDENGHSYMVNILQDRQGVFYALGGGEVTLTELKEAQAAGYTVKIYPDFAPDPEKITARVEKLRQRAEQQGKAFDNSVSFTVVADDFKRNRINIVVMDSQTAALITPHANGLSHQEKAQTWQQDDATRRMVLIRHANDHWQVIGDLLHKLNDGALGGDQTRFTREEIKTALADWSKDKNIELDYFPATSINPQQLRSELFDGNAIYASIEIKSMAGLRGGKEALPQRVVSLQQIDVKKVLHFIWLGKLEAIQQDYITVWQRINPDYQIKIWYDSGALLAHELDKQIKSVVARELIVGEEAYLERVTALKDEAHQAISQSMEKEGKTFDQAATDFMVHHLDCSAEDLARIKTERQAAYTQFIAQQKDAPSAYRLEDISALTDSFIEKKYYYQELALGQDLTAASNIARLNILSQQGSIYLDNNLLPALTPLLSDPPLANIGDINLVKAQLVTEYLIKTGKFSYHQRTVKAREYDYASHFSARSPEHKAWIEQLRAVINPGKRTRPLNDFFQPLGQLSINHNGLQMTRSNGAVSNTAMVAHPGSNMLKAVCQHINENYRLQVDMAQDAKNGSIAIKQGMEKFARQRSSLLMNLTDAEWFFEQFDPYAKEMKQRSQVSEKVDHRSVFTRDQLSQQLKDIPVLTGLVLLQRIQDQLHSASGVKQVEIAFRLQQEIRRLLQASHQTLPLLYSQTLAELNQQINHMLFSQPLPGKAYIIDIARQQPALAAQLYKTAFNEAQGYHLGLTDFLCFWINEDPYLKPLTGSRLEAVPMPFEVTFRIPIPLGKSFAQVHAALSQARGQNVMVLADLDTNKKVLSLGYSYQDLSDLAAGNSAVAMVFSYLKEIALKSKGSSADAPFEQLMLNQFADRRYLRQLQDARLAQATSMYSYRRNMDFDAWDRQYSIQGSHDLNQQLQGLALSGQLAMLLSNQQGLLIGEEEKSISGQRFVIEQIDSLKLQGITILGLGCLRQDRYQPLIDAYFQTGNMPHELKATLAGKSTDITHNGVKNKSLILLFQTAYEKEIKILAMGNNSVVSPEMGNGLIWQATATNSSVVDILKALPEGKKFVVLHDSKYLRSRQGIDRFIPGLAQSLGLPMLALNADRLQVVAGEDPNRPLFTLLDSIIEHQKQQASHNHWSQWYAMTPKENIAYKMAVLWHLDALQQETFSVLAAEYLQMNDNPGSLGERITALSLAIEAMKNNIRRGDGSQKDKDYLLTLEDMRTMYQQHKDRETAYEQHWKTRRNDLLIGGIKANSTNKLAELDKKIAILEGRIADLNVLQLLHERQISVEPSQQNGSMPHQLLGKQVSTPWNVGASRQLSLLQRQVSAPPGKQVDSIIPADFLLRRLFTQGQRPILTAKLLQYQRLSAELAAYKDIKKKYQDEMSKPGDINIDEVLRLPPSAADGYPTNISLLNMEEKPGWIRMYISLVDANYDGSQKELYLRNNEIIVQPRKAGGDINFSFGTAYRSLAWHQQYRLSPTIKHGPVYAPIRSVLVKTAFVRDFFGTFMESKASQREGMQVRFVKDNETVKLVNVDQKHSNQMGINADLKGNFQKLLNQHADVSSFTTIASRSYQQSFYHADRDGEFYDIREMQHAIGLGDEQYLLPFLVPDKSKPDMATAFSRITTGSHKIDVGHLSPSDLTLLYDQNSKFFEKLEQVRNGTAIQELWYSDPIENQKFRNQLTHLLEINYLTPARLLENSQALLWGSQRDVNGNHWLKAQWEGGFAQSYLTDETAQQAVDQLMEKFVNQLLAEDERTVPTLTTEEKWATEKETQKNAQLKIGKTAEVAEAVAEKIVQASRKKEKQKIEEAEKKSLFHKILQVDYVRSDLVRLRQKLSKGWSQVTDRELLRRLLRNELHINGTFAEKRSLRQQIFFHALHPAAQYYQSKAPAVSPAGLSVNNRQESQAPWLILNNLNHDDSDGMRITDDKLKSRNWYRPDQSEMSAFMADLDTPFSGGISATTRDVTLQLTNLFGSLNVHEYWSLQLFNAAQMINNGYHSFFETLYVAAFLEDRFVEKEQCIGKQLRDTFDDLHQRAKRGEILNGQLYEQTLALILPKLDNSTAARYVPPEYGRQHHPVATASGRFRDLIVADLLRQQPRMSPAGYHHDYILDAVDRLRMTAGKEGIEAAFMLQHWLRIHQQRDPNSGYNPVFKELDQQIEQRLFHTTRITAADRANLVQIAEQQPTLAAELYYALDRAQDSPPKFAELPGMLLALSHLTKEEETLNKIKLTLQEIQQPANDDKRAGELAATKARGERSSSSLTPEEKQAIKNRGVFEYRALPPEELQRKMAHAAKGLEKLPFYQGTVYYSPVPVNAREVTELFDRLKPNQLMSYRGLLTTDASIESIKAIKRLNQGRVIYVLEGITEGRNTAGITDKNTAEILLTPDHYFRVTASQKVGDNLYLLLTQEKYLVEGETIRDLNNGHLVGVVDYGSVRLRNGFSSVFHYPDLNPNQSIRIETFSESASTFRKGRRIEGSWQNVSEPDGNQTISALSRLGAAQRDNVANWATPPTTGERFIAGGEAPLKRRIIVQLENDAESLRSAIALAEKHPGEAVVYQRDVQGNMRLIYGDPIVLSGSGEVALLLVGHGRGGLGDVQDNTSLAGYSALELAALPQQISQKLALDPQINKLVLVGCALVNDDKKSGFLFDAAAALAQQRGQKPAQLVAYASELAITDAAHARDVGHRHQFVEGRIGEPVRPARISLAFDSQQQRYFPAFTFSMRQEEGKIATKQAVMTAGRHPNGQPSTITREDEAEIKAAEKEQTRVELQQLERMANTLIKHYEKALTSYYGKKYRFFGFENVGDQIECIFKTTDDQQDKRVIVKHDSNNAVLFLEEKPSIQEGAPPGKRIALQYEKDGDNFRFSVAEGLSERAGVSREQTLFTRIQEKMLLLEPEIAQAEGISTMNAAFLALHLLSQPHDDNLSPWKKFVGMANVGQILHGIGQDLSTIVRTIKLLRGAGTQAESMLGKLLGGTAYTHAGSVVNVAIDIINFIDAISDLNAMPPGPQKDFVIARVALAGTQLAVDTGLAILPVVASIAPTVAPAIASFMGVAGPLSVVFAGMMIGVNALLEAITFNNTHYQIELDEVVAPFRHSKNKTILTPIDIAQVSDDAKMVYFEPYVPLKKIRINGQILSVQVADIGIPRFNPANREHSTTHGESLSAYTALGFDVSREVQQYEKLRSTQYLLLPAALDGHYNFMHDVGAYGSLDGKEVFNRFSAYYNSSDANVFHVGGDHSPNHTVFIPRATEYVIELDETERSIAFQSPQKLTAIKGDDHEGLHSRRLPTPLTDAENAYFLTYRFKGGGGITRIDLFDDRRQIIIQPHQEAVKRKNERWVLDITPDTLDAIANRKKVWSEWQQRPTITYGEAVLALLNMGIAPADMSKIHDKLVEHIREAEIPDKPLLGGLEGFFWSVYDVIQRMSDPLSDLHTKVDLRTLMEAAEPFVQKLDEQDQASSMVLQQGNIAQLRLAKSHSGWDLQLANNKKVHIDGELPGHIALQMRIVELPGITFTLTASARPGGETPKFYVGLEAASREALLADNLTKTLAFIQSKFANDPRFVIDQRVPIAIRVGQDDMAKGLLDLATQRWQAISNIDEGSAVAHPHFYNSQGDILPLLIAPQHTTSVAHIEYDTTQQQLAVVGVAHPFNNRKSRVDYHYFHDLPQNARYQQLKAVYLDEKNGKEQAPLMALLDTLHTQSNQQMISIKAPMIPMDVELAWDTEGNRFFRKATWQKDDYQFTTFATDASNFPRLAVTVLPPSTERRQEWLTLSQTDIGLPISSLTLSIPPEISGIDLSALPAIPTKVFAPIGTKIRGLDHQTTLFLHTEGNPKVMLKLTSLPVLPGTATITAEAQQHWGLALMIDSQEELDTTINLAQINQALRTHFTDQIPFTADPYLPLLLSNRKGEIAEGIFDITTRRSWLVKISRGEGSHRQSRALVGDQPDALAQAMSSFQEEAGEIGAVNRLSSIHDLGQNSLIEPRI